MNSIKIFLLCFLAVTASLWCCGCGNDDDDNIPYTLRTAVIACTDYQSGSLSLLDLDTLIMTNDCGSVSSDPAVKVSGNNVYIVNRFLFDNIQVQEPYNPCTTLFQFSTGNGSNPQDIEWIERNKVYITRFESPFNDILIADPDTGEQLGSIDLASAATNADRTPRAAKMIRVGNLVYCLLQNIDASFSTYEKGILVAIDADADTMASPNGVVELQLKNPTSIVYEKNLEKIFVGCSGDFYDPLNTCGVEIVDPGTMTSEGVLVSGNELRGVPAFDLEIPNVEKGYVITTDPSFTKPDRLVAFSTQTGALLNAGVAVADQPYEFTQMAVDSTGYLYLCKMSLTDPEIIRIDTLTDETHSVYQTVLPPVSIDIVELY